MILLPRSVLFMALVISENIRCRPFFVFGNMVSSFEDLITWSSWIVMISKIFRIRLNFHTSIYVVCYIDFVLFYFCWAATSAETPMGWSGSMVSCAADSASAATPWKLASLR